MNRNFYTLSPEVAGGLGRHTEMDASTHPPHVTKLHYEIDCWSGDESITSFPCFIVTERMKSLMEHARPSGCTFADVEITASGRFRELHPTLRIPRFFWLKIVGQAGRDDFSMSPSHLLVVSQRLLEEMKKAVLEHCGMALV
jgi:hypothetical protein